MKKKKEDWDNGMTIAKMDGNELPIGVRFIWVDRNAIRIPQKRIKKNLRKKKSGRC